MRRPRWLRGVKIKPRALALNRSHRRWQPVRRAGWCLALPVQSPVPPPRAGAPALVVKFSSLQVNPESQYSTGGGV